MTNELNKNFSSLSPIEIKIRLENSIENIIGEIDNANRLPTKWEADHIKIALDYILAGMYNASAQAVDFINIDPNELANPEPCFSPEENISLNQLTDFLYFVKGVPVHWKFPT